VKTVQITSEVAPYSKTGILGNSVSGLSRGLRAAGMDVCVFSPMYLTMCTNEEVFTRDTSVTVHANHKEYVFDVYTIIEDGISYRFLRNDEFFGRRNIYGSNDFDYSDNDLRFGMFSMACLEYIRSRNEQPDIIHCHEWPTGLVPVYRKLYYQDIKSKIVFTAHDISYQGIFNKFSLQGLGLPWSVYNIDELEYYENISMLKGGIVFSDFITVPSPSYCRDIQTEEHSKGLGLLMSDKAQKLAGILEGIDYDIYNPATDKLIKTTYDIDNIEAKTDNKSAFLTQTEMKGVDKPLFLVETKFTERKGLELIIESAEELSRMNANFAFFGHGESYLCSGFKDIAKTHDNMFTFVGLSETMVHLAYAAADFILRPSMYEPSGNSHLKGMRYGALPVVSKTGGHLDTVIDVSDTDGYGFFMSEYSRTELLNQITSAVDFFQNKTILNKCIKRVMQLDFSWDKPVKHYLQLYEKLLGGSYDS
jgi:starch synthase